MTGGSSDSTMRELKGQADGRARLSRVLFKLEHMLKDVQLCLEESRGAGASFPFAALAGELYSAGVGRGLGQEDFAAVLEVVEGLTGDGRQLTPIAADTCHSQNLRDLQGYLANSATLCIVCDRARRGGRPEQLLSHAPAVCLRAGRPR